MPYRATSPYSSASSTGLAMSATAVRRCTPASSLSLRAEAEPDRRIVVAAGKEHRNPRGGKTAQRLVEHRDRVGGRNGPVVDVPCHHHRLHLAVDRLGEQPIEEGRLVGEQVLAVQRPPEMPVRGVEQSHPALQRS